MKHNVFDNDQQKKTEVLSHADQASIISMAKSNSVGSLRTAMDIYAEQNPDSVLAHGIDGIETLFPEYKDVRPGAPELLTTDQGWVNEVLKKVHKSLSPVSVLARLICVTSRLSVPRVIRRVPRRVMLAIFSCSTERLILRPCM